MISQLISPLIAQASQSSDSYGRTDGRTNEDVLTREVKVAFRNAHRGGNPNSSLNVNTPPPARRT